MQDAPKEGKESESVWPRRVRTTLWPLLVAEVCFAVLCAGVGLLVWRDIDSRAQQHEQRDRLHTFRLQAELVDERLIAQTRYLYQLQRATRRLLLSSGAAASVGRLISTADERRLMSPSRKLALFREPGVPDAVWRSRARMLAPLEALMNDLYLGDALIERLFVRVPPGVVAVAPGSEARAMFEALAVDEGIALTSRDIAQRAPTWQPLPGGQGAVLGLDVVGDGGERLAQVGLVLDTAQLAQMMRQIGGSDRPSWLVDAHGRPVLGEPWEALPGDAGPSGISVTESREGQERTLAWATLPTPGWVLVSRLPAPGNAAPAMAWVWLGLGWLVGSLLILVVAVMTWRQRLQRWQVAAQYPLDRLLALGQRVIQRLPEGVNADGQESEDRFGRLEAMLKRMAHQPCVPMLLDGLERPALLTHGQHLVAVNGAFEHLVGRSRDVLTGKRVDELLLPGNARGEASEAPRVRVCDGKGHWQVFRVTWSEDDLGYGMGVLEDESASEQRIRQLTVAREHARRDARLKTRYLSLLRREFGSIRSLLARWEEASPGEGVVLRERLSGLMELLGNVSGAPLSLDESSQSAVERKPAPAQALSWRVLIVDDGPVNTALAHSVLVREGHRVDVARGGAEALALGERHFYDLVFMDISMPAPNGIETSRRWRERERLAQHGRRSVLVALTANASDADRDDFLAAGMDDHLAKPYRPQALVGVIRRWLPSGRGELPC